MDVIFAILIWRIFILFPRPEAGDRSLRSLTAFFRENQPNILAIVIGLVFVVVYWLQNNTLFGHLKRTDGVHTSLAILQVFFLLCYLYSVRLGTEFEGDTLALILQSATLALVGIAAIAGWRHATKGRLLLHDSLSEEEAQRIRMKIRVEPISALITLPCALVSPVLWELAWLVYPVALWAVGQRRKRRQA